VRAREKEITVHIGVRGFALAAVASPLLMAMAQTPAGAPSRPSGKPIYVTTVDGAVHPERIPDEIATFTILSSLARAARYAESRTDRRWFLLTSRIGLGSRDQEILVQEMVELDALLTDHYDEVKAVERATLLIGTPDSFAKLFALRSRERVIVAESQARLSERLSRDGNKRLREHITRQKQGMRLFGPPK